MSTNRNLIIIGAALGVGLGTLQGIGAFDRAQEPAEDQGSLPGQTDDDRIPPRVELPASSIETPLRGVLEVPFQVSDASGDLSLIEVRLDDLEPQMLPSSQATWEVDTQHIEDGTHTVTVRAVDSAGNEAEAHLVFTSDNTPPEIEVAELSSHVGQGQTIAILIRSDAAELALDFLEKDRQLFKLPGIENTYRALVGVPVQTEARDHPLYITADDVAGNRVSTMIDVEVEAITFRRNRYIRGTPGSTAGKDQESIEKANEDRAAAYAIRTDSAMWVGSMAIPVIGNRTSEFGNFGEYANGTRSPHYGTDYEAQERSPVTASAAGTVSLAGWQADNGNVVILDHGHGVSTSYNHLSSIAVESGDSMSMGDRLGEVGDTGQATKPHLHWEMTVDGVSVNAEQWLEGDFLPKPDDAWFKLKVTPIEEMK